MKDLTKNDLLKQIAELEIQLIEAKETIEAIRYDKIDALVISTDSGDQIFTLEGADRPYRIFLEQMNEGAVTTSNDGTILYGNKSFADMLLMPLENITGKKLVDFAEPNDAYRLKSFLSQEKESAKEEIIFLRSDNSKVYVYLSLTQLIIEGIDPVLCVIATDLTEKKKSEDLIAAEKLARSILEQAAEAIVVCDEDMRIIRANKTAEELAGEPVLFKSFDTVFPLFDNRNIKISMNDLISANTLNRAEASIITDSKKINLIITKGELTSNGSHALGYVISLTNITKHIEAEEKLTTSLKEKTVLLKEIHHRVKNNLQIISSLLALQASAVKEEQLINILGECRNRISSMALIHQKLYESRSLASISISDYLHELISSLNSTYRVSNCEVRMDLPSANLFVTIELAIPLGLIMNELVTNSLTHAFKDKQKGFIDISLHQADDGCIHISMSDTGIGFPAEQDFYHPDTLGLQLVHTLVQQVNGKIELVNNKGTELKISLPCISN